MKKNIAEKPVVTLRAKMWKSRVNVITGHARSRLASSRVDGPLTWRVETIGSGPTLHYMGLSAGVR